MTPVSYIQQKQIKNAIRRPFRGNASLNAGSQTTPQHAIAERFVRARLAATSLPDYPGVLPASLAQAYATQEAALSMWPEAIVGWKVARIGPAHQAQFPEERLIGPIFQRNVHVAAPGIVIDCPVFAGGFAAVEAEIGIYVRAAAPKDKVDWTPATAADWVAEMCIGVEMAGSPLATLNELGPGAVISDFGNNWGVIAGAVIPDWRSFDAELACETFIDDVSVGKGSVAIPQTPLSAFAFALNKAAQRGRPLRAGDYITTGLITGVHVIAPGQSSRISFGSCGEILCRAVSAQPFHSQQVNRA
jgi:2-keto-4-pentenoate hydratase